MDERGPGTTHFAVIPEWVLHQSKPNAVMVYALLDRHSDKESECFPSLGRLAQQMDVSDQTVRRAVRDLEKIGAVERFEREREDGGRTSNGYRLTRDPPLASGIPPRIKADRGGRIKADRGKKNQSQKEEEQDFASLSPSGSSEIVVAESKAPKLVKIDGQNLGFNALCEVCKIDSKGNQAKRVVAALNGSRAITVGIRDLVWRELIAVNPSAAEMETEAFERYLANRIREQAVQYQSAMKGAFLTPTALATWWTDLHEQAAPYNAMQHLRDLRAS